MARTTPGFAPNIPLGIGGSLLVHVLGIAVLLYAVHERAVIDAPVYAVDLVAAPLPSPDTKVKAEAPAPPIPDPADAVPEKTPDPKAAPLPTAKVPKPVAPKAAPRTPPQPPRENVPTQATPQPPIAGAQPSTGVDATTIKTPGLDFPFPEYLRNIMNQVYRRWGTPNSALRAEVSFSIARDGTVKAIGFAKRSGNFAFDLDAQGAIEAAGNARAFGPLPDGWTQETLNVVFVFEPRKP
jgi:protein TonB